MLQTRRRDSRCSAAFAVLASVWASSPLVSHAQTIATSFVPSSGTVCKDTLFVDFTVDAAAVDLRGFTVVFEFDPTFVVPVSVERGALMTGAACGSFFTWINAATVGDSIWVDGATLGCSMQGPGSIVRMGFARGGTQGTSPLRCRSGSLRNSLNQSLPYTCAEATVTHYCAVAALQRTWTHVKSLFH